MPFHIPGTPARSASRIHAATLTLVWFVLAPAAPARGQSSTYLHLHHPAYLDVDLLLDRGILSGLSPVLRPLLRSDVARAVAGADTAAAGPVELAWLARLRREFRHELDALARQDDGLHIAADVALETTAMTHGHRDLLRADGSGRLDAAAEADFRFTLGALAGASRLRSDSRFLRDHQLRVTQNRWNERAEDAYLEIQTRYLRLLLGRLYRNWAPAGVQGSLLSDYAPSFDQAALRLGTDAVSLILLGARLDDFPGDVRRYVALHRLDVQPSPRLALYAAEAVIYGGPGRDYELEFLNPLSFWFTENENQPAYRETSSNNVLLAAGAWWRASPAVSLFADFTLDDVQVDPAAPDEPISYTFTTGLVLARLHPSIISRVTYTQVSHLSYRTPTDFERYTFRDLGLGRDFSDYDALTAEAHWFPVPELVLTPRLVLLRRGEGDFRQPFPADFDGVATILEGVEETTVRLALRANLRVGEHFVGRLDAGENVVRDVGHVPGARRSEFVARVSVAVRFGWAGRMRDSP